MLSFFKSKPFLKDILPANYTDIHNHLLPGIDDGAANVGITSTLIRGMKDLGISQAVATPHTFYNRYDSTIESINQAFEKVQHESESPEFITRAASEYMLDYTLIERAQREQLLCIKDNYLLVELNLLSCPIDLYELLFELKNKNYRIILAHPERYGYFHQSLRKFEKLRDFEVDFQMNLLSIAGYYSKEVLDCTKELLEQGFYSFTGTDIHHLQHIDFLKNNKLQTKKEGQLLELLQKNQIF
jgi:protein-tyrosine phosphatase